VSGLLVTPRAEASLDALRAAVAEIPGCEPGAFAKGRLVVVAASDAAEDGRSALRRLEALPGVAAVDVVFVSVEPPRDEPPRESAAPVLSTLPGGAPWT